MPQQHTLLQPPVTHTRDRALARQWAQESVRTWAFTWACTWLFLGLLALAPKAHASEDDTPSSPLSYAYATQAGDTLDKIVSKQFKDSPLNPQRITQAIQQLNPALAHTKAKQRLKTGMSLQLPTHDVLVHNTLKPYLAADAEHSANAEHARKRWIRYP